MGAAESGLKQPTSVAEAEEANTHLHRETTFLLANMFRILVETGVSKNSQGYSPEIASIDDGFNLCSDKPIYSQTCC